MEKRKKKKHYKYYYYKRKTAPSEQEKRKRWLKAIRWALLSGRCLWGTSESGGAGGGKGE